MFNLSGTGPLTSPTRSETYLYSILTMGGSSFTLTSDLITGDLIIQGGYRINTNGYRIYCKSLTMLDSVLSCNGGTSSGSSTGGTAAPAGSLGGGGVGTTGSIGDTLILPIILTGDGYTGGNGGNGGDGSHKFGSQGSIASFRNSSSPANYGTPGTKEVPLQPSLLSGGFAVGRNTLGGLSTTPIVTVVYGGGGGGGGGSSGTSGVAAGGGGGGGGGVVFVCCTGNVSMTGGSFIEATGGSGSNGNTVGSDIGGGGGGAGGGGVIITCNSLTMDTYSQLLARPGTAGVPGTGGSASPTDGAYGTILINTPNGIWTYTADVTGSALPTFPF
jgi:hypothetical protein